MIQLASGHPAAWAAAVLGLLFCFLGRRLFTFFLACSGFAIGFCAGALLFDGTGGFWEISLSLAGGLAGAVIALILLRLSMFLGGAVAGYALAAGLLGLALLPSAAAALATGLLAALLTKQFLSVLTAAAGALAAVAGASVLAGDAVLPSWLAPVLAAALALAGALVQLGDLRRRS